MAENAGSLSLRTRATHGIVAAARRSGARIEPVAHPDVRLTGATGGAR